MRKQFFIFLLIALAVVYVLILRAQGFQLEAFSKASLFYATMAFLVLLLILAVRSFKYWFLLRAAKINAGIEAFPTTVLGFYSNFISPIRISELVRTYSIKHSTGKSFFQILPPTIMDSLIDTSAMLVVIVVLSFFAAVSLDYWSRLSMLGGFLAIIFAVIWLISTKRGEAATMSFVQKFSKHFLKGKLKPDSKEFSSKFRELIKNRKLITAIFFMAIAIWVMEGLKLYLMIMASGFTVSLITATLIITTAYLIGGSFVNPSGITQETILLILLLQLPFQKESLMLAGSLDVLITVGTILILGTVFFIKFGLSKAMQVAN